MSAEQRRKIAAALTKGAASSKVCSRCRVDKPATEYGRRSSNPEWLRAMCRKCEREYSRAWSAANPDKVKAGNARGALRRRGTDQEEFDRMFAEQGGVCAICGRAGTSRKRLAVDHCHRTKRVRGLLCDPCNTALGLFGDDIERLHGAIRYLS